MPRATPTEERVLAACERATGGFCGTGPHTLTAHTVWAYLDRPLGNLRRPEAVAKRMAALARRGLLERAGRTGYRLAPRGLDVEHYPGRTDHLGITCHSCGSTRTYGQEGNAFCAHCGAHDQDGG